MLKIPSRTSWALVMGASIILTIPLVILIAIDADWHHPYRAVINSTLLCVTCWLIGFNWRFYKGEKQADKRLKRAAAMAKFATASVLDRQQYLGYLNDAKAEAAPARGPVPVVDFPPKLRGIDYLTGFLRGLKAPAMQGHWSEETEAELSALTQIMHRNRNVVACKAGLHGTPELVGADQKDDGSHVNLMHCPKCGRYWSEIVV